MHQSSFISTNRAGRIIERCVNILPLNTPLSHVVTKYKGGDPPEHSNHDHPHKQSPYTCQRVGS